jgi:hypothetical protein
LPEKKRRPKHPNPAGEECLKALENGDPPWVVTRGTKYYRARCTCKEKHQMSIYITPSNDSYFRNVLARAKNHTCYKERGAK